MATASRAPSGQSRQQIEASGDQRLLLGARPTLDLSFGGDRIDNLIEVVEKTRVTGRRVAV